MGNAALEKLIWVLIYVGLLAVCLGLFVRLRDGSLGLSIIAAGGTASALGAILIWVRSRRGP